MKKTKTVKVTKDEFRRYQKVQYAGRFNMIAQAVSAARSALLPMDKHMAIIEQYDALLEKHGELK